jgi:hypothetical protein
MAAIGGQFKRSFKLGRLLIPLIPGDRMDRRMPRCALRSGAPEREPEISHE